MKARSHFRWATVWLVGAVVFAILTAVAAGRGNWTLAAVFAGVCFLNCALVSYEMHAGERKERA